jgi:hypothetical protein
MVSIARSAILYRDSNLGCRVRSVTVEPRYLDNYFTSYDHCRTTEVYTPRRSWRSSVPVLRNYRGTRDHVESATQDPFENFSTALVEVLSCFPYVMEYKVRWCYATCDFHSVLVMAHIWESIGSNLSTLHWESPLETLHLLLLETPSIHFPSLRNLALRLHRPVDQSGKDGERFHFSIAPFVNRHCPTIRNLSFLSASKFLPPIDATSLLPMVDHFPRLQELSLEFGVVSGQYIQMSTPLVLTRLLDNHASTLQNLSVRLLGIDKHHLRHFQEVDNTLRTVFHVGLNNLVTLQIYYDALHGDMPMLKGAILEVARHYSDTLTTLILDASSNEANLTYEEVETLVTAFSHRSTDAGLKTLLLVVDVLSPQLLDLLASALPSLTKLTLRVRLIRAHQSSRLYYRIRRSSHFHWAYTRAPSPDAVYNLDSFKEEMKKRVYSNWALRHIDIRQTTPSCCCIFTATIIAECIPNAEYFQIGEAGYCLKRHDDGAVYWFPSVAFQT